MRGKRSTKRSTRGYNVVDGRISEQRESISNTTNEEFEALETLNGSQEKAAKCTKQLPQERTTKAPSAKNQHRKAARPNGWQRARTQRHSVAPTYNNQR